MIHQQFSIDKKEVRKHSSSICQLATFGEKKSFQNWTPEKDQPPIFPSRFTMK